jgi:predicted RNA-binding protein with PUA-like domain
VVGIAEVSREAFQDSTDGTGKWITVKLKPVEKFTKAVSLDEIKAHKELQNIALIKQSRLSVMPLTRLEFETILKIGDD